MEETSSELLVLSLCTGFTGREEGGEWREWSIVPHLDYDVICTAPVFWGFFFEGAWATFW